MPLNSTDVGEFDTIDIDGNKVSKEIFKEHKYTVVYVWGTFCASCIRGMPELNQMSKDLAQEKIGLIGVVIDAAGGEDYMNQIREQARHIRSELKSYIPAQDFIWGVGTEIMSIPAQFLVDNQGKIVSELYSGGVIKDQWLTYIKSL